MSFFWLLASSAYARPPSPPPTHTLPHLPERGHLAQWTCAPNDGLPVSAAASHGRSTRCLCFVLLSPASLIFSAFYASPSHSCITPPPPPSNR